MRGVWAVDGGSVRSSRLMRANAMPSESNPRSGIVIMGLAEASGRSRLPGQSRGWLQANKTATTHASTRRISV